MVCKLSIVIPSGEHAGAIIDTPEMPNVGDRLTLGNVIVEVVEVKELLPPRGDFHFVHVTGQIVRSPPPR
jgi:hypothetical protein